MLSSFISFVLYLLTSNAWAAATAVPGKPFEYLANLAQSSNTPVLIRDANNNEVGTFLGLGENQTRVMLGLTGSVDGEQFSFVVGAEKNGFDSAGRVIFVYKWIDGAELDQVVSVCGPYNIHWADTWKYRRDNECGQALVAYINNTAPCSQDMWICGAPSY